MHLSMKGVFNIWHRSLGEGGGGRWLAPHVAEANLLSPVIHLDETVLLAEAIWQMVLSANFCGQQGRAGCEVLAPNH